MTVLHLRLTLLRIGDGSPVLEVEDHGQLVLLVESVDVWVEGLEGRRDRLCQEMDIRWDLVVCESAN